jgi:hypothetical protein
MLWLQDKRSCFLLLSCIGSQPLPGSDGACFESITGSLERNMAA